MCVLPSLIPLDVELDLPLERELVVEIADVEISLPLYIKMNEPLLLTLRAARR
jgi:hypothetical protein